MRMLRFHIGRSLIVAGLKVMPQGRVRSELSSLLDIWSTNVYRTLDAARIGE